MKKLKFLNQEIARPKRGMTVIELMMAFLVISILAATSVVSLNAYVKRSRLAEPYLLLSKMADQQIVHFERNRAFIEAGPTNIPPTGQPVRVDFVGNWVALSFSTSDQIRFGYRCYEDTGPADFICEAQGDQDADGDPSIVQIRISANQNQATKSNFFIFDELE
jgi:prepilin-type N-terminal cleavage/methylation domain-containing protein